MTPKDHEVSSPDVNRDSGGFTLVELLVVLVIFGVVGGVVGAAIVGALRSSSATSSRLEASNELRIAMQRMTRDFRTAQEVIYIGGVDVARDLTIDIDTSGAERLIRYRTVEAEDGSDTYLLLREDGAESALVTSLTNPDVFGFFLNDGTSIDCSAVGGPAACVRAVQIRITLVRELPGDRPPVELDSVVTPRNARYQE